MAEQAPLKRITVRPEVFGGKPITRHAHLWRADLELARPRETPEAILEDYPDLEPEDIRACIVYAHAAQDMSVAGRWRGREVPP